MSRASRASIAALMAGWAGSACGGEVAVAPETGLLRDVVPVEAGPISETGDAPLRLSTSPIFRAGGPREDEVHQFVAVDDATVREDGSVIVVDGRTGTVRVFDARGEFIGTLGSPGRGPGEFRSPTDVRVTAGDSVVVWDQALWRTSVFGPTGNFVRSERYDPTDGRHYPIDGMWPATVSLGPEGGHFVRLVDKGGAGKGGAESPSTMNLTGFALHTSGAEVELMGRLPAEEMVEVEAPWGLANLLPPLAAGPRAVLGSTDTCVGHQALPEVLCIREDGSRVGVRWTDEERKVRPDAPDVVRWRAETVANLSTKMSAEMAEELVDLIPMPERRPAFEALHLDPLGYLWVDLGPVTDDEDGYLVFDRDLAVLGRLDLPAMDVLEIGMDYVLGVRWDAMGVEEVVVYSLHRDRAEQATQT